MNDWQWKSLGWIGALAGSGLDAAALLILARAGGAAAGPMLARAARHPGLWALAWLLQGLGWLCWCLVPLAVWDRYRGQVPTRALVSATAGVAGFFMLAQLELARSGGMAFLSTLYRAGSPMNQGMAAELAQWQQRWLFGGSWEAVAAALAPGLWLLLTGRMIAGVEREPGGHLLTAVGLVTSLSLAAGLILRLFRLPYAAGAGLAGSMVVLTVPVWLLWVMWTISQQRG